MAISSRRKYQFPYLGGVLTGTGLGLWLFPVVANIGIYKKFGMVGVIVIGMVLVFLGVAMGLPTRAAKDNKEDNQ